MRMRKHIASALVLALIVLVVGCNGDGDSGAPSATNQPPPPAAAIGLAALRQFGFGQALVLGNTADGQAPQGRQDVALAVPYVADRQRAQQFFDPVALGRAANIAYTVLPNAIRTAANSGPDDLTVANYNTWTAGGSQLAAGDIGPAYPNDRNFSFLRVDTAATRSKAIAVLQSMLANIVGINGIYVDLLDPSIAFPNDVAATLRQLKQNELQAQRKEPVVAANFASLRTFLNNPYFDTNTLASTFDVVFTEEYKNPRFPWPDKTPADVVDFHKRFPSIIIIVNVRFKMNNLPGYQPDNTSPTPDTPCAPPFAPIDADHARVREAVTVAALVGGLHAVDDGTQCHGKNTYAASFLNFPILRPGLPSASIVDDPVHYRRDYAEMIAIHAKTSGSVPLPPGNWLDYWDNQGRGPALTGTVSLAAGTSYLLFKR
jgi:hypothetical protein